MPDFDRDGRRQVIGRIEAFRSEIPATRTRHAFRH